MVYFCTIALKFEEVTCVKSDLEEGEGEGEVRCQETEELLRG